MDAQRNFEGLKSLEEDLEALCLRAAREYDEADEDKELYKKGLEAFAVVKRGKLCDVV